MDPQEDTHEVEEQVVEFLRNQKRDGNAIAWKTIKAKAQEIV